MVFSCTPPCAYINICKWKQTKKKTTTTDDGLGGRGVHTHAHSMEFITAVTYYCCTQIKMMLYVHCMSVVLCNYQRLISR